MKKLTTNLFFNIKKILIFILLVVPFTLNATTYYVKSNGSDSNTGLSDAQAWKTISKVNSSFSSFVAGSSVLFNKGDIFTGTLTVSKSGSSGNPITIGSYGSGANPVITGFVTLSSWTNEGGSIYSNSVSLASTVYNIVTVNGVNTPIGRYPSTGWYNMSSSPAPTTTTLTGTDLNSSTINWATGGTAEVVIRVDEFRLERLPIFNHSGQALTFTAASEAPLGNAGYFIQNDLRTLDATNEWFYGGGKFYIYGDPSSKVVKVSSLTDGVVISSYGYITFDGLSITGFGGNGFNLTGARNITIQNCSITYCGEQAILGSDGGTGNSTACLFDNNVIDNINSNGILLNSQFTNSTITNNTISNIGLITGAAHAQKWAIAHEGIALVAQWNNTNALVEYNSLTNIAYIGILMQGTQITVRHNIVNYAMLRLNDGGGIYTYSVQADPSGRVGYILNNIVLNSTGNKDGTYHNTYLDGRGIYLDGFTTGETVDGNTIAYCSGANLFINGGTNCVITNNTICSDNGTDGNVYINDWTNAIDLQNNMQFNNNKIIAFTSSELAMSYVCARLGDSGLSSTAVLNYNYYARPINDANCMRYYLNPSDARYTLAQWKTLTGKDANSNVNLDGSVTNVSQLHFIYNETKIAKIYTLSATMKDVTNASYSGTISLPSSTSLVLIGTGTVTEGGTTNSIDFYIDPTGSNSNDGSSAHPWLTLAYACAHTISGNIIHVNAGTYSITTQISIPVGVSIEGSGVTSIIQSTVSTTDVATLLFDSPNQGTNGNQHISNLKMDGVSLTGQMAIRVNRRSNVIIHDITFNNFMHNAIYLQGGTFGSEPTTYATGNQIYNCIITNCAGYYNSNGYGNIDFSGQDGLLLHDSNINQTARTGLNGYCTKAVGGYNRGVKIYNNTVTKAEEYPAPFYIIMEFWDVTGGIEIYGNTITGGYIDCGGNFGIKRTYSYTYDIHNNTFALQGYPSGGYWVHGIGIEGSQSDVIVRNNSFTNFTIPICLTQNGTNIIQNIYIYYNIFKSISSATGGNAGVYLYNTSASASNDHIYILNNVFYNGTVPTAASGVRIQTACPNTNIYIENNIFQGLTDGGYVWLQSGSVNGLTIQNNIAYGNGNSNNPLNTVTPTNYTYVAAIKSLPSFVTAGTDFHLQGTSPAINAGVHITTPTITTDYDGVTINNPPEIGAYEYSGSVLTTPIVTTTAITNIATTSAISGGNATSDGGASVTARGICWNISSNPTTANSKTTDGTGTGVFTSSITNLTANTTYHVRAYATNSVGTAYGVDTQFTTLAIVTIPTITTTTVTNIAQTTAISGGNVTADGGAPVTARGVCWSTSINPIISNTYTLDGTGTGTFTSSITGLTANTVYHVRAYATNSAGTAYGSDIQFTTLVIVTIPIITTTTAITNIAQTTATSGGNITSDGGASVTARGICWNTSINPTIANSRTSDSTGTGVFTSSITGLIANTAYHIRAYATNNTGTAYGVDVQFTTLVASVVPTVTATTVMNITETTATFGGNVNSDGNSPVTARGVCWSVQPNPIVTSSHTTDGTGTGVFVSSITGLMSNTLYHVRAYATNAIGTAYSTDISFTTLLTIVAPTVLTTAIMNITSTTAVGGGNVTADGNSPVFGRGICWSTIVNPTTNDNSISDVSGGLGTYLLNVLNLISNTLYHVRAYATNAVGTIYGNDVTFTTLITPVVLPTVTTTVIGMITQTTAISGGNVTSDGGGVTVRGVCWSKVSNPTIANSFTNDGTGTGIYISTLTGLIQNTTYHIRAYATNSAGTSYGTDISFTTLNSFITVPTVSSTTPVTNIAKTTVTSGGNISTDGGAPVTARGVCWAATINPTIANSKTSDGTGIGVFVSNMTGMTKSTNYHVRAYATNSVGTAYGNDIAFKTDDVPTVITTAITNKLSTSVTTGGNVTNDDSIPVTARGICWSKTINPIVDNLHTVDGVGLGKYVSQITGLIPNTTYHVRAYATNSAGTAYGSDISFTTLNIITNSWIINPNPAKTYFTIKLVSGVLPSYVKIYNMNDKLVLQKYIGNGVTSIVINIHLNIGKYVVCLDNKIINSSWKQLKTNIILFVQ